MARFNNGNSGGGSNGGGTIARPTAEIVEPRCAVCKSTFRRTIDQLLVMGVSFAEIARQFEQEGVTRRGLSNHKRKHLSVEQAAVRQIIEEKARQIGEDVENTRSLLLTRKGYMEVAMMKSYQAILDGTLTPEPRDIVHMIALMEKMEKDSSAAQVDEMLRDFNAFSQAVREVVGKDDYDKILYRFKRILEQENIVFEGFKGNNRVMETLPTSQVIEVSIEEDEEENGSE
jgi:hypothetical protein